MKSKNAPERTCIGCRAKKPKKELIRITLDLKGNIVIDKTGKGRGSYLCKFKVKSSKFKVDKDCLEQAIKKNTFKYAFKEKIKKIKIPSGGVKIPTCRTTANCNGNGPC